MPSTLTRAFNMSDKGVTDQGLLIQPMNLNAHPHVTMLEQGSILLSKPPASPKDSLCSCAACAAAQQNCTKISQQLQNTNLAPLGAKAMIGVMPSRVGLHSHSYRLMPPWQGAAAWPPDSTPHANSTPHTKNAMWNAFNQPRLSLLGRAVVPLAPSARPTSRRKCVCVASAVRHHQVMCASIPMHAALRPLGKTHPLGLQIQEQSRKRHITRQERYVERIEPTVAELVKRAVQQRRVRHQRRPRQHAHVRCLGRVARRLPGLLNV